MNVDAWHVDGHTRARCLICGGGTTEPDSDWLAAHEHPEFMYGDRPYPRFLMHLPTIPHTETIPRRP